MCTETLSNNALGSSDEGIARLDGQWASKEAATHLLLRASGSRGRNAGARARHVTCYQIPDLFSGKLHALLYRKWKNRLKGRDWFDFE